MTMGSVGLAALLALAVACSSNKSDAPNNTAPSRPKLEGPADAARSNTKAAPDKTPPRKRPVRDAAGNHLAVRSAKVMGTRVTVSIWGNDEVKAAKATESVFKEFRRIDALMTSWGNASDVSKINAAAGKTRVVVGPEVLKVMLYAQHVAAKTGGAFDITVGGFRGLWKFDQDRDGTIPSAAKVKARLSKIGYKRVNIDAKTRSVKLADVGMRITLGGIAKGYAVDQAVTLLHKQGVRDFILQAGGDLYTSGQKGGREWRVGIRDPRGPATKPFAMAQIKDHTFSTSGDYERTVVKDGVRYHHILDPKTGRPVRVSRSVTVMAKSALVADGWSTALFVLGAQKGLKLVEKMPDLEAVFVDDNNQVHISSGLKNKVWIMKKPTKGI